MQDDVNWESEQDEVDGMKEETYIHRLLFQSYVMLWINLSYKNSVCLILLLQRRQLFEQLCRPILVMDNL